MHGCNSHDNLICIGATSDIVCGYRSNNKRAGSLMETMMAVLRYLFIFLVELDIKFYGFFYDP
jgi:hypothetical protein